MWLTGRLTPDFKTIANLRKDSGKAIRGVCRKFVMLCQQLGLFVENLVAIDGSKFKAVNNRRRNFTSAKLKRRMEEIESSINRYLTALDTADRQEPTSSEAVDLDPVMFGTHTMRRTKASLIYSRTKNLWAVQLMLDHTRLESTVRYLGIEVDNALEMAE